MIGCYRQMQKRHGKIHRPRIEDDDVGPLPLCLAHGHGQHGGFADRIDPDGQHEIGHGDLRKRDGQVRIQTGNSGLQFSRCFLILKKRRAGPPVQSADAAGRRQGFKAAAMGAGQCHGFRTRFFRNRFDLLCKMPDGGIHIGFPTADQGGSRPFRIPGKTEPESSPVADKMSVDRRAETGLLSDDLTIPRTEYGAASQGAMGADRFASLEIPPSAHKPRGFVRVDTRGADIDQVAGKRAFKHPIPPAAEIDAGADAHDPQVRISGVFPVIPGAAVALDAAVHLVLHQGAQVLIEMGSLAPGIPALPMPPGHGHLLKQAVPPLIANRTIVGMVGHEPFDHAFPESDRFRIGGGYHHPVSHIDHAAHLNAGAVTLNHLDGADTAGAHRAQGGMVAEPGNHDAQAFGCVNHLGAGGHIDFLIIDNQYRHGVVVISPAARGSAGGGYHRFWHLFTNFPFTSRYPAFKRAPLPVNMHPYLILKMIEQALQWCGRSRCKGAIGV